MTTVQAHTCLRIFPPDENEPKGVFSRYAGHDMLLHAANVLGCTKAAEAIDISKASNKIGHNRRYNAILLGIASGKPRLSNIDELIPEEFAVACGGNYPKKSSNHAYIDEIVARDIEICNHGQESIIEKFVDETTKGYHNAGIIESENIYIDKHVVEIDTKENIPKDMHGTKAKIVKSIGGFWAVCAKSKNPITFKMFNGGQSFSKLLKPFMEKIKSLIGKPVKLIGVDKGAYNYAEITKATAEEAETCIVIWAKDTPAILNSLEALDKGLFEPYETINEIEPNGSVTSKVKSSIADAGEIIIDEDKHMVRTIVIQNEQTGRRVGILIFGKKANEFAKEEIADFLYGKQDVENHFKERKKVGSDKFCGGEFKKLESPIPTEKELIKIEKRINNISKKLPKIDNEITQYKTLLDEGKISKKAYNGLVAKSQKDKIRLTKEMEKLKIRQECGKSGIAYEEKPMSELDVRKMTILSQIQDHVIVCRKYILQIFLECLESVLVQDFISKGKCEKEFVLPKVKRYISNLNKTLLSARLFEQGGYVYTNYDTSEIIIAMKKYENPFMQEAFEIMCERFSSFNTVITSNKRDYRLIFTTEDNYSKIIQQKTQYFREVA
jgi:hypothetical protein